MPELPEVETVRVGLEKSLQGATIESVELHRGDIRFPIPKSLPKKIAGAKVEKVSRRAKYLLIETDKGTLLSHLGMTGTWRELGREALDKHDHVVVRTTSGRQFAFRDPRRFGVIDWIEKGEENRHKLLKNLGYEPLENTWTADDLFAKSRGRKAAVKIFIMDQKIIVGVGNIYASEALFRAGVRPTRAAGRVSREEWGRIASAIREILQESIEAGGSTISDYRSASGAQGRFQNLFRVYDRKGEPCVRCHTPLKAKVIGGRSTYWCQRCQR